MALNKTIVKKVREKTVNEPALGDFLVDLLEYESETHGWFKADYSDFLEKACKEEETDANS